MTLQIWGQLPSQVLGMDTSAAVITPTKATGVPPKTLILLHGLTGNHLQWVTRVDLVAIAEHFNLIIVAPDGERSFWLDQEYGLKWGTWIGQELPQLLSKQWDTKELIVGGLSMGGYGAFRAAFDYPQTFQGAFSLSGTLDVKEDAFRLRHPDLYRIGFGNPDHPRPEDDLVARPDPNLPLFACCGTEDRLFDQNLRFTKAHPQTRWEAGPGDHNFDFWAHWLPRALESLESLQP